MRRDNFWVEVENGIFRHNDGVYEFADTAVRAVEPLP